MARLPRPESLLPMCTRACVSNRGLLEAGSKLRARPAYTAKSAISRMKSSDNFQPSKKMTS